MVHITKRSSLLFTYTDRNGKTSERRGHVNRIFSTKKKGHVIINVFDTTVNDYRSFDLRRMKNIVAFVL